MKLTLETEKQKNLLSEVWWPHKAGPCPNFLGRHCVCTFSGCSPQYEINEIPVTWLIAVHAVCERVVEPAAPHSRRRGRLCHLALLLHPMQYVHKAWEGDREARAKASAAEWGLCRHTGHGMTADGQPAPSCNTTREEAMPSMLPLKSFEKPKTLGCIHMYNTKHKQSAYNYKNHPLWWHNVPAFSAQQVHKWKLWVLR